MAYVSKIEEEKDKEGVLQGTEGEGVKQLTTTGEALQPGAAQDISTEVGTPQGATPTGGQDVSEQQKYLEANRQKAMDLAAKTGGIIRTDIDTAKTGLTGAGTKFEQDVNKGIVKLNQDLYGSASKALVDQTAPGWNEKYLNDFMAGIYQPATQAQSYEEWFKQKYPDIKLPKNYELIDPKKTIDPSYGSEPWLENPNKFDGPVLKEEYRIDPNMPLGTGTEYLDYLKGFTPQQAITNKQAFMNQYNAAYGGPSDIQSQEYYAQAMRDLAKAERTRGLTGDLAGRQELIARTYEDPSGRFSRGTIGLDEALLSGYDETMKELNAASDYGLGLQSQSKDVQDRAAQLVKEGKSTTEATKQAMREKFNLTGEEGEIKTQTQAIQDKAKKDYEDYLKYIQSTYGVKEGVQATQYFDKPQDYLNVQAQNVMSAQDVARLKALEELTGGISTLTPFSNQAGQYKQYINPADDFRLKDFQTKVDTEKAARLKREADEKARLQAIADAEAAAAAAAKEAEKKAQATAIGAAVGATAGAIVGSIVPGIGTAAGAVVGGAVGAVVGSIVCYDADSEFEMSDGTYKRIADINIGDHLKEGGVVYTISKHALNGYLYSYPTGDESTYIWVTGKHAVKEDGKWIRVENSRKASIVTDHDVEFVYSLSCKNHVMISNGVCFADFDEVDNAQGLTDPQCLNILNGGFECTMPM